MGRIENLKDWAHWKRLELDKPEFRTIRYREIDFILDIETLISQLESAEMALNKIIEVTNEYELSWLHENVTEIAEDYFKAEGAGDGK